MSAMILQGARTLFYKEVLRFWKVSFQTVAAPILKMCAWRSCRARRSERRKNNKDNNKNNKECRHERHDSAGRTHPVLQRSAALLEG